MSREPLLPAPDRGRNSLILVGHGSHLSADSSGPIYRHAERLRESGRFGEVLEAFWKEEPSLRDALALAAFDRVVVVPLFLAEGYFTRQVVPRELGIGGPLTRLGSRTIHYLPPVGAHPAMADLILRRAGTITELSAAAPRDTALIIVGHGTERSETSGGTVYRLVKSLRERGAYRSVECGFLDERPTIREVLDRETAPDVVLVPFFVADGWHTRDTIPAELGLSGPLTERGGQRIRYTPPVGTLPEVAQIIREMALEALARPDPGEGSSDHGREGATSSAAGPSPAPIVAARRALLRWLDAAGSEHTFLQLTIRREAPASFTLMHAADAELPADSLTAVAGPDALREIVRTTHAGRYRPQRATPDLRRGWILPDLSPAHLWDALAIAYPAAALNWHRFRSGTLEIVPFSAWANRQSGMYAGLRDLGLEHVVPVVDACCGPCLRHRLWPVDAVTGTHGPAGAAHFDPSAAAPTEAVVPCREPCTVFGTSLRQSVSR